MAKAQGSSARIERGKSLRLQIADWIRWRILRGIYDPGSLITAIGVVEQIEKEQGIKCSRTPVREAMDLLAGEGLRDCPIRGTNGGRAT